MEVFLIVAYKPIGDKSNSKRSCRRDPLSLQTCEQKAAVFRLTAAADGRPLLTDVRAYSTGADGDVKAKKENFSLHYAVNLSVPSDGKPKHLLSVCSNGTCRSLQVASDGSLHSMKLQTPESALDTGTTSHRMWSGGIVTLGAGKAPRVYKDGRLVCVMDPAVFKQLLSPKDPNIPEERSFLMKDNYMRNGVGNYGRICQVSEDIFYYITKTSDLVAVPLWQPAFNSLGTDGIVQEGQLSFVTFRNFLKAEDLDGLIEFHVGDSGFVFTLTETGYLTKSTLTIRKPNPTRHTVKRIASVKVASSVGEAQAYCTAVASTRKYVMIGKCTLVANGERKPTYEVYSPSTLQHFTSYTVEPQVNTEQISKNAGESHILILKEFAGLTVAFSLAAFKSLCVVGVHREKIIPICLHIQFSHVSYNNSMVIVDNYIFISGSTHLTRLSFTY